MHLLSSTSFPHTVPIEILHVDAHLLVVTKPSMLLSVPGRGPEKQDCLVRRVAEEYPDVLIVHRLDWETSGLIVLPRNKAAHREIGRQFEKREVKKEYTAVIHGELREEWGSVELPLCVDWPNRPRHIVDHENGKPALTHWERLEVGEGRTRVRLHPVTGRTHQLRVHMLALGHPILGDRLYAHDEALAMAERLLLHATTLRFTHPVTGKILSFHSEPPF